MKRIILPLILIALFASCSDDNASGPQLVFKFTFDPDQERLDNLGQPSTIPVGHAAQTPSFNTISANYIELATSAITPLGLGEIVYKGEETSRGGALAIDFDKAVVVREGEVFISVPLADIEAGAYEWLRVSLSYQNYDILLDARIASIEYTDVVATAASFIGYNTYISDYTIKEKFVTVDANKLQGYVGVETTFTLDEFQAPPGATTVPNPLFDSSPVPAGSCVVTGPFDEDLVISGDETRDIVIDMSVSINNSFEWEDDNGNGKYEPLLNEDVVDMGVRGLMPRVVY